MLWEIPMQAVNMVILPAKDGDLSNQDRGLQELKANTYELDIQGWQWDKDDTKL